jgi:hypothetical protein
MKNEKTMVHTRDLQHANALVLSLEDSIQPGNVAFTDSRNFYVGTIDRSTSPVEFRETKYQIQHDGDLLDRDIAQNIIRLTAARKRLSSNSGGMLDYHGVEWEYLIFSDPNVLLDSQ